MGIDRNNRLQQEYFNGVKYRSPDHPVVTAYADPKIDFIRAHAPLTGSILDLACGNGIFTQRLSRDGAIVTGLDLSTHLLSQNPHGRLTCGDAASLPFGDASFDLVFAANLLHHVRDVGAIMKEMHRVSRKYVVLLEPNRYNPLMLAFSVVVPAERGGLRSSAKRLQEQVSCAGLHLLACRTTGMISQNNTPQMLLSALRRFDRQIWWGEYIVIVAEKVLNRTPLRDIHSESVPDEISLWEAAYLRFETPQQEIRKFRRRLIKLGAETWSREADVVELFCGRGNGLQALAQLGFRQLEGVDLSPRLVAQYTGTAECHVADCTQLPFADHSKDLLIVQGGLHHLTTLPDDLDQVLSEARRVLREDGRFVAVEPWLTLFLRFVHTLCDQALCRRLSSKLDDLATMIQYERRTYEQWLEAPDLIMALFSKHFEAKYVSLGWGKMSFVGSPRPPQDRPSV